MASRLRVNARVVADASGAATFEFQAAPPGYVFEGTLTLLPDIPQPSLASITLSPFVGDAPWGTFLGSQISGEIQQWHDDDAPLVVQAVGLQVGHSYALWWIGTNYNLTQGDRPTLKSPATPLNANVTTLSEATLDFQHNDALIASEQAIDVMDTTGFAWTLTDDPTNKRMKLTLGINPPITITGASVGSVPMTVQAFPAETADVFDVKNSAGAVLFGVDPNGNAIHAGNLTVTGNLTATGQLFTGMGALNILGVGKQISTTVDNSSNYGAFLGENNNQLVLGLFNKGAATYNTLAANTYAASLLIGPGGLLATGSTSATIGTNIGYVSRNILDDGSGAMSLAGTLTIGILPAFATGDRYLVVNAAGVIHKSAIGPAS